LFGREKKKNFSEFPYSRKYRISTKSKKSVPQRRRKSAEPGKELETDGRAWGEKE
jgi:hypothetical protein